MVPAAPRRHDPVRREPAEEVPGHLPVRLRDATTGGRSGTSCRRVVDFWIEQGVRIFRVDNPHTKPFAFWEWLIGEVKARHPEAIFLAEAFTRPKVMYRLAKLGFTQSYTYFTWRNTKEELTEYLTELTRTEVREFFRPEPLAEHAGHPARVPAVRRAAGVRGPLRPRGDARRELRHLRAGLRAVRRRAAGPGPGGVPRLGEVRDPAVGPRPGRDARCAHRAGQRDPPRAPGASARTPACASTTSTTTSSSRYSKHTDDWSSQVLVVVNLDPHHVQAGFVELALDELRHRRPPAVPGPRPAVRRPLPVARARATTSSFAPGSPRRTSSPSGGASAPSTTSTTTSDPVGDRRRGRRPRAPPRAHPPPRRWAGRSRRPRPRPRGPPEPGRDHLLTRSTREPRDDSPPGTRGDAVRHSPASPARRSIAVEGASHGRDTARSRNPRMPPRTSWSKT